MSQKYQNWDRKGPIAEQLVAQFDLYLSTNGAAGINPSITKPKTINQEVYEKNIFLQTLNPARFLTNFRKLAVDWKLNKDLQRARKGK